MSLCGDAVVDGKWMLVSPAGEGGGGRAPDHEARPYDWFDALAEPTITWPPAVFEKAG